MWVSTGAIGICALIFIIAIYSCMVKHAAANSIALFAVMFQDPQTLTSSCNFTRDNYAAFIFASTNSATECSTTLGNMPKWYVWTPTDTQARVHA